MSTFKKRFEVSEGEIQVLTANVAAAEAKFSEELMNCAKMHDQRDQYKRELDELNV